VDSPDLELQEVRRLIAELTARVFRIEQALNLRGSPAVEAPRVDVQPPSPAPSLTAPLPAQVPPAVLSKPVQTAPRRPSAPDLESRIGSHWLNRIGISAVLIGVSYFLKFAFDNNWIGPTGRVVIGLLAGIAIPVLIEAVGPRLARQLLMHGGLFDAETALRIGLVDQVVAPDALDETVATLSRELMLGAPSVQRLIKALVPVLDAVPHDAEAADLIGEHVAAQCTTEEALEGMRAFLDKRKPGWTS